MDFNFYLFILSGVREYLRHRSFPFGDDYDRFYLTQEDDYFVISFYSHVLVCFRSDSFLLSDLRLLVSYMNDHLVAEADSCNFDFITDLVL